MEYKRHTCNSNSVSYRLLVGQTVIVILIGDYDFAPEYID